MQKLKIPRYIQWLILVVIIFLIVMSLLRVALVLAFNINGRLVDLIPSFILGARFDFRIISIATLIVFLTGSLKFLHPFQTQAGSKISFTLWTIFCIIFCLFNVVDFLHYAYLSQRLNASALTYVEDAKISFGMAWESYPIIRLVLALIAAVALLMWLIRLTYNYILSKPILGNRISRIGWGIAFFLLLAVGIFGRVGQYPLRWSDAFALGNDQKAQVALNPFQSFFSSLNYRYATYDKDKVTAYYDWMAEFLGVNQPEKKTINFERVYNSPSTPATLPNVVLVICESFSSYKSSMVGNPLNTTPYFNDMVKEGVYFDRCFSPSYGTARGVWAIVTGIPDVQLSKTASRNPAAVDQHTIINDFKGYEKFYFLGGSTSWANIRGLLTNNIKDLHLYEEGSYKAAKIDVWGISDKNLFLEANKVLATQAKPFFAVIQTADNHRPYTIPDEDLKVFKKQSVPMDTLLKYGFTSIEEYNAFRYTDFGFQQFMEAAKREKYFDNTIFVFVGDHGINGEAGNLLPKAFTEDRLTSQHVPLLFYAPRLLQPARYSFAVSQVDVLPTLAGIAKINYTNTTLGRDLLQPVQNRKDAAFIMDIDNRKIGVVHNNVYYGYGLKGIEEKMASVISNDNIRVTDSLRKTYRYMTDAFYETARYMLLNNRKKSF